MKKLGFLNHEPVSGLPYKISPFEFVSTILEQQLQYNENERDLSIMVNIVEGLRQGQRQTMTCSLLIKRDLSTGLMAMNMGVAYPACIVAEMIVNGEITKKGILSPATDIPGESFITRLTQKGIFINESIERP